MVCADSDFIADLDRGNPAALAKLDELEERGEPVYTTTINVAELYRGALGSRNREHAFERIEKILSRFSILNLDYESAKLWGEFSEKLKSNSIGELDLLIASMALSNKQALITRNKKHFERVRGLQIEGW
jgi:tRNA(fMet)-specific endonuclease VapC